MKPSAVTIQIIVFIALMILLALTVGAAYLPLGPWSIATALTIAFAKTSLVLIYFMQLRSRSALVRVFAIGGFFWLSLLFLLTYADYLTRGTPL